VETEPVSTIPAIEFKSFELVQETDTSPLGLKYLKGILEFTFIDGDADIGLMGEPDTTNPYSTDNYNVIINPYEKIGLTYFKIIYDTADTNSVPPYFNIKYDPKFDRVGQNKTIKGNITINIPYFLEPPPYDTIRYEFYIFDRARNQSNIAVTSDIGFTGYRNGDGGSNGF
jgi:hypothetical protein